MDEKNQSDQEKEQGSLKIAEPEAEESEKENGEVKGTVQNDMEVALEELPEVMGFGDFGGQGPANNNMPVVSEQGREYPAQLITPPGNLMGNPAAFQGPVLHYQPPPPPCFNGPNQPGYWHQPSPHYHNQGIGFNVATFKNDLSNEVSQMVKTQVQQLGQELKDLIKNQNDQEVKSTNESKKRVTGAKTSLAQAYGQNRAQTHGPSTTPRG